MKRTLIAIVLGISSIAPRSYGFGTIYFSTYFSSSSIPAPVVWGNSGNGHSAGQLVTAADGLSAELWYGLGAGLSFNQLTPLPDSITTVGTLFSTGISIPGIIADTLYVTIPDWTSGPVTFGIEVFNSSGVFSTTRSTWTEPGSAISPPAYPPGYFSPALLEAAYPNGIIVIPEPDTVMLIASCAAAVIASRRRLVSSSQLTKPLGRG